MTAFRYLCPKVSATEKKILFDIEEYVLLGSSVPHTTVTIAHHWFRVSFQEMNILALMRSCHILLTYIAGIWALHILPIYPLKV